MSTLFRLGLGLALTGVLHANTFAGVDVASEQCVSCHANHISKPGDGTYVNPPQNHPVGLTYASYVSYGGFLEHPNARLIGGKVSCVSCHRKQPPHSDKHGKLAIPKTRLCHSCHVL